jgi:hypothetical protein
MAAEKSISAKTEEVYERRNEKGKEMKNYQDAEKQLLAIQAAQQANLRAGKINNLAQFRNTQNLIGAGNVLQQTKPQQQTQQVAVNPQTQQILQRYGAGKPGTVTKRVQSRQETAQNVTINNNTTNTTHNQINAAPPQQQVIRPQRDNSNEKFKLWLNNTLARQQEDYARREKEYDKRESSLERDSNKMLRKLGEFSKDIMEKMDPRRIGSTATSQIKSLLFIFGFQYLASNWVKLLKTVSSIENSFKRGLAYFGLYNLKTHQFEFSPGKSQLAYDISGLFSGKFLPSPLMVSRGGGGRNAPQIGGEGGMFSDLRKILLGNIDTGGKDKGLVELIKEFFVNQGRKRMAAAKMVEKPEYSLGNIEGTLSNIGDYLGQLLGIFLGDPDEAVRGMIKSKINISAAKKAWSFTDTKTGEKFDEVDRGGRKYKDVKQGIGAYFQGEDSQRGLSLGALDKKGNLRHTDAEGSLSQSSDLALVHEDLVNGKRIDTERYAAGMEQLLEDARANGGKTAVMDDFLKAYLDESEIQELEKQGKLKRRVKYDYAIRDVDVQDDNDYYGHIGREQEQELQDYLNNGIAGDSTETVANVLNGFFPGLGSSADFVARAIKGTFNSEKEVESAWKTVKDTGSALKALKYAALLGGGDGVIFALDAWDKLFGKDPNKPGYGTEKRKVLLSREQQRSGDVILAKSEFVNEITEDVLNYINAKGGITRKIDTSDTKYNEQVQESLARKYAKNNKTYSNEETDKTFTTLDGKKKTVHLSAEEASVLANTGYYIGADKDYAQFINEQKYREERDKGNLEYEKSVLGEKTQDSGTGATYRHSGAMDKAYEESMTDLASIIDKDTSLKEFYSLSSGVGKGEGFSEVISGLSNNWRGNKGINNTLQATDSNGKVHNIEQLYNSIKHESPEKIKEVYDSLVGMDFNAGNDIVSTLSNNTRLKDHWVSLFSNIYSRGIEGDYLDSRIGKTTKIDFDKLLKDPEGYGQQLIDDILKSMPKSPQELGLYGNIDDNEYAARMERYEKTVAHKNEAIKHIQNLVSYFRTYLDNVDRMIGEKRKSKVLEAFSKLMNSRVNAEAVKAQDLHMAEEYTNNDYKRTVAASDNNMLRMSNSSSGGSTTEILDKYNSFTKEWDEKDQQYKQDLEENAVTSKAISIINGVRGKLLGVKETFDEYSEETKDWLGGLFSDAKNVVNGFLRNLDYTKVSMARWPNGYRVQEKDGLLLWHCFNNNSAVKTDFIVKGASGRFGAGRLSYRTDSDKVAGVEVWDPHADTEENQGLGIAGLYDRLHSGQDISGFYQNDVAVSGGSIPFYAPFNGYVISYRDYKKDYGYDENNSGSGRSVFIRQKKEGSNQGGRYCIFVCHLSQVSQMVKNAYASKDKYIEKGTELGKMGRSGKSETSYSPHFHVNILDTEAGGPFDGPLTGDLPGIVHGYKGFTLDSTKGAVDPMFVFCDSNADNIKNRTLYLSSDKRVVYVDDANPSNKEDRYKGGDIDMEVSGGSGESGNENDKDKEENESLVDTILNYLKDFSMKLLSGDFKGILGDAKETVGDISDKAKQMYNDFFGKYRNKSVSFRQSSRTYTGPVTSEMVNYQNYKKHPGAVGLGPDGKLLTETQWRNKVYDMSGSDPSALHIGEILKGSGKENLKTVSEVGGEAQTTINNYSGDTSNVNAETVNSENNSDNTVNNGNMTAKDMVTAEVHPDMAKQIDLYSDFNKLVQNLDKDEKQELVEKAEKGNELTGDVLKTLTLTGETLAAALDESIKQQVIGNAYLSKLKISSPSNTCVVQETLSFGN